MNIEAYNLDTLRNLVRNLQAENKQLRNLLREKNIVCPRENTFEKQSNMPDEYDPEQGNRIIPFDITESIANHFLGRFWGRLDVYAKRGRNGGYYPQCENRWNSVCPKQQNAKADCDSCQYRKWETLPLWRIVNHLKGLKEDGSDAIGIYPLFPEDNTCRFLVFDFDNHEKGAEKADFANTDEIWKDEVNALRRICKKYDVPALVERSRSGRGAHIWIFFRQRIPAVLARNFGLTLLDRGAISINLTTFRFYDRMYPSRDVANSLGNLIALPLQGQALKHGNSAFVDESWNAYADQMDILLQTPSITMEQIHQYMTAWNMEMTGQALINPAVFRQDRLKPWKRNDRLFASDVTGIMHFVLADGLYVDALNLNPHIQNQIRCMATIDNPQYFQNLRSGRSNYYHFSTIYMGKDTEGYIRVPRGLFEKIRSKCEDSGIAFDIEDNRQTGRPIRVEFSGSLKPQQQIAAESMLQSENGILSSATGSGKTVMCSYLIARRKVNTLILVNSVDLIDQWVDRLKEFLTIDEPLPVYQTPKGKTKMRESVIGTLSGGIDKTGGIIDIAMIGSAYHQGDFFDRIDSYGMVIMDECHHAASSQAQAVLNRINCKYVYGVSATVIRSDKLEPINYMLLGPVRHEYTAKEHAFEQGISLYVRPRFTRVVILDNHDKQFHKAMDLICESPDRNEQIIQDIINGVHEGRTPVILTGRKRHARTLYDLLQGQADHVFLMYGDQTAKENQKVRKEMLNVSTEESMILIATGQKLGEGFDCPRLDTLMLVTPVKFDGRLTQYAGRLSRQYPGKTDVIVYDYVDTHIGIFDSQYRNRLTAYKRMGYQIQSGDIPERQFVNAIYDRRNYTEAFEQDLILAEREIVIASPGLIRGKVERLLNLVRLRIEQGVSVTVITIEPEEARYGDAAEYRYLIEQMVLNGITVRTTGVDTEHFAIFDRKLIWHGGMNLLGQEDAWDNLIRVESHQAAAELLEMAFQDVRI